MTRPRRAYPTHAQMLPLLDFDNLTVTLAAALELPEPFIAAELARRDEAVVTELATAAPHIDWDHIIGVGPVRGTFRTPWPLACALFGVGYDTPATSRRQIATRLGLRPDQASTLRNITDQSNYFGLPQLTSAKDGPPPGAARLTATAVHAAWAAGATSYAAIHARIGTSATGKANRFIDTTLASAGIDAPAQLARRRAQAAAIARRRVHNTTTGQPARHYTDWIGADDDTLTRGYADHLGAAAIAAMLGRSPAAVRTRTSTLELPATAPACAHCGTQLATQTGPGAKRRYCSDPCRYAHNEQLRSAATHAAVAATQGPCEHCGKPITPGPRHKRFDTKSCAKKAGYAAKRAAAAQTGLAA